ncbi:MAG: hybrid sensor histidine kinase/response regulator [Micavibrio sp.]|nr:hybrid sensor histidine kinase/response regulator [Micavibrio sp.]
MFCFHTFRRWLALLIASIAISVGIVLAFFKSGNLVDIRILFVFVILFCGLAGFVLFYLTKERQKERDILREVFEGSRAARLVTDSANRTMYTNQKFLNLCGVEKETASYEAMRDFFSQTDKNAEKLRLLVENAERGTTDSTILPIKGKDGEQRWYKLIAQPVAGWGGHIHWRIDDITETHNIENIIREEREKLVKFTDHAPVGFFSVDHEGKFLFVNATLASWLGTDVKKIINEHKLHDFLPTPPKQSRPYDIMKKGGKKQVAELYMKSLDGKKILVSINQSVVEEMGGGIRTNAVVHDLTTEREMRQALEASEDRFHRFFEEAPLGVVLLDQDHKVIDANKAFSEMLEISPKEIIEHKFCEFVEKEYVDTVAGILQDVAKKEDAKSAIEVVLGAEGKKSPVELHARRFKGSKTLVLHFIDMTDQKSLEQQFAQSQKMQAIGQLAGGVAHDFNNLLTAMTGFCDLLLLRHKPGDPSFSDISQIKQNANRAANLVRQLLAFSRQQTLHPRVLDITDTLTELSHLLRRLLGASVDLDVVHGHMLGLVKVDEGQLEQVLINLAVNARDAMMEAGTDGKLTIQTSNYETRTRTELAGGDKLPAGKWIKVAVSDTGCGIPKENFDRIFEPFFTTKEIGAGTGLGLATVYGIMRQTGGFIDVESKVGKGTTFTLYLPQHEASGENVKQEKTKKIEESEDLTGTATILLVEDEDAVRTFSARALTNKGYQVLEANGGDSALALLNEKNPAIDLLITDVIMPGMDGPTLAKEIQKDRPDLKIIFISGYTEDKFKDELGEDVHFMPKPFTLQKLAAKVKEVLAD